MRRALKDIIPPEILERKRKAYLSRAPVTRLRDSRMVIEELFSDSLLARSALIDRDRFQLAFRAGIAGDHRWIGGLISAIKIELWLRSLKIAEGSRWASSGLRRHNEPLPASDGATRIHARG
jgi:asparagine synthase (glutamine-hydrolysing)